MARIRTIKPEFWEDEKLAELPMGCRLFFVGTWNFADDQGVFRANAKVLKSKIFPYDDTLRLSEVQKWIDQLEKARMIIPIIHNGESYYVIRTFKDHQIIDKRYCKHIVPQQVVETTLCSLCDHYVTTTQEEERKGKEKEEEEEDPAAPTHPTDFEKFQVWVKANAPRVAKMEKPITEKEFMKLKDEFGHQVMMDYLTRMENYKPLLKNSTSANLTLRKWIAGDKEKKQQSDLPIYKQGMVR